MSNVKFPISNKKTYDIHERIFSFVVRVISFINTLPKTQANLVIINQLLRSVTSMGANDQEADGAVSRKDFLHCFTIVRKEGKETIFWLRLIAETNPSTKIAINELVREAGEIVLIISTIIKNTTNYESQKKEN